MRVDGITPILNVSDLRASLDWFEALGWRRHPDGHTFRIGCESGR
jgi:hypothetical protein